MKRKKRPILRYIFVAIWVLSAISLIAWWIFFGLAQIHRLQALGYQQTVDLVRYQKMLIGEGTFLLILLVGGGAAIAYYMYREIKQGEQIGEFFLTFTHETKTALASVQLQAEMLTEEVSSGSQRELLNRFLTDLGKLGTQLENSLTLANLDNRALYVEEIDLADLVSGLQARFPGLEISFSGVAKVKGDRRSLESIFANIGQNAISHGKASAITISVKPVGAGSIAVGLIDNGAGFHGNRSALGERMRRHYSGSGSGLGLFIVSTLVSQMQGKLSFPQVPQGFAVEIVLSGVCK